MTAPRTCGGCTMCCKLLGIPELKKMPGTWCSHCHIGTGCRIYEERPQSCRDFMCMWLQGNAPDGARPDRSKVVLWVPDVFPDGAIIATVDPTAPDAWQQGPVGRAIQQWLHAGRTLVLRIGHHTEVRGSDQAQVQQVTQLILSAKEMT